MTRVDLRESSVRPSQAMDTVWIGSTFLPISDHPELFAPHPQHRIPALLQKLSHTTFPHSKDDTKAQEPYVIHVDRERPKAIHRYPPPRVSAVSRIAPKTFYVDDAYTSPSPEPEWKKTEYSGREQRDPVDIYDFDSGSEYGHGDACDHDDSRNLNDEASESGFSEEDLAETFEEPDSRDSPVQDPSSSSPVFLPRFESLSPSPPLLEDTSPPQKPTPFHPSAHNKSSSSSHGEDPSTASNDPDPVPTSEPAMSAISVSDNDSDNEILHEALFESLVQAQTASQFYNPRAQAGLAPPQKRRRTHSPGFSSEYYDSEEERKLDLRVLGDPTLMLLRNPPPWHTLESLVASRLKPVVPPKVKPESQGVLADPKPATAHLAKKRKTGMGGAMGIWSQIKASSKPPSQVAPVSNLATAPASTEANATSARPTLRGQTLLSQTKSSQKQDDKPVRRTTLGRAPRPPGTTIWKV